mmetsp:Transcript_6237/g.17596  ORF Transcript_6237/g.17596 Transcript_6237/m.17596 type:complete len:272 (+) Transcript_6237:193-1008(+)
MASLDRDRGRSEAGRPAERPPTLKPWSPRARRKSREPKAPKFAPFCDSDHRQSSKFSESTSAIFKSQSSDANELLDVVRRPAWKAVCFRCWWPMSAIWPAEPTEWIDWCDAMRFRNPSFSGAESRNRDRDAPDVTPDSCPPESALAGGGRMWPAAASAAAAAWPPCWAFCACTRPSNSDSSASSEMMGGGGSCGNTALMGGKGTDACMGGCDEPQPAFKSSCCRVAYLPVEWFSRSCSCCCCFFFAPEPCLRDLLIPRSRCGSPFWKNLCQ